jgi:hypothetical protein
MFKVGAEAVEKSRRDDAEDEETPPNAMPSCKNS